MTQYGNPTTAQSDLLISLGRRISPRSAAQNHHCHVAVKLERKTQLIAPTIAPMRHVVSVPPTIDLKPSDITSLRRSGAMVASPPIMIPSEPKLANPHIA